jgi:hypothetical protein
MLAYYNLICIDKFIMLLRQSVSDVKYFLAIIKHGNFGVILTIVMFAYIYKQTYICINKQTL